MKLLLTDCATLKVGGDLSLDTFKQFGEVVEYENITRAELLTEAADTDIYCVIRRLSTKRFSTPRRSSNISDFLRRDITI